MSSPLCSSLMPRRRKLSVVMDVTGEVFYSYGISAFPTTFMIGADGNVFGYVPGALTGDMMESIVQQTIDGVEAGA